jgi:hypothetical protein
LRSFRSPGVTATEYIHTTTNKWGEFTCNFKWEREEGYYKEPEATVWIGRTTPETRITTADWGYPRYTFFSIRNVPEVMSPYGLWYARRIGKMTPYPIVHLEGYDPQEKMKSGLDITGSKKIYNYIDMLKGSELPGGTNVYQYILNNEYTFWMLLNGDHSGNSFRGDDLKKNVFGAVYQAMHVVKQISDLHKEQFGNQYRGLIVGGFSGGGLAARTGLLYWCNGFWSDASDYGLGFNENIDLPIGCQEVLGWYAGDAPLEGCMMPGAAQKAAYDEDIVDRVKILEEMRDFIFETPYAAEILRYTIPWYDHDVNCEMWRWFM